MDNKKIESYKQGIDITCELPGNCLKNSNIQFTSNENDLDNASFFVVAVPTPINDEKDPDFRFILSASEIISGHLKKGDIIVYESTVYPGVTEELCVPVIEQNSGLKCIDDFKIGYSPERISPGDKHNRIEDIKKIVSGIDEESFRNYFKSL